MAVVDQSVVVILGGTLPGQNDFVGVAGVTVNYGCIGINGSGIGDAQSAIRIAGIDHAGSSVDCFGSVDFTETTLGHIDGHDILACGSGGIGNRELAIRFFPGSDQVSAAAIGVEFQNHIVFAVGQTLCHGIYKAVAAEIGCFGCDGREGAGKAEIHSIAGRTGCGMGKAGVITCGRTATFRGLHDFLLQGGDSGQIFRVESNVVQPAVCSTVIVASIDGTHRDGYQERRNRRHHLLGHLRLNT